MNVFYRKPSDSYPTTHVWGITATKWAVVIYFGLHSVVIELPQRKLTPRALDGDYCTCKEDDLEFQEAGVWLCDTCHRPRQ